jgi:hypothetical protein
MRFSLLGLSVVLTGALAMACSGADQNSTTNSGGSGTGTETGAAGNGGGNTGGNNTGGNNTGGNTGGDTGNTGGAGGGIISGGPCGGIAGTPCNSVQYCDYADDTCGGDDGTGTCVDKPEECPDVDDPVCACDGKVYPNACAAAAAGADLSLLGACPAPPGTFACGSGFCDQADDYCLVQMPGDPDPYTCEKLPPNCNNPGATCACLSDLPCGTMCEETDGGFTVTCP